MKTIISRSRWWLALLCGLGPAAGIAPANPESIGNWMPSFAEALGLGPDDLPYPGEFAEDFTGVVAQPEALAAYGLAGVVAGDKVRLHNHANGYWTVANLRTHRELKLALAWLLRFGVTPDRELADGEPPDHITGTVVKPAVLARFGFTTAAAAKRFRLDYANEAWTLTLEPGGESRKVPF